MTNRIKDLQERIAGLKQATDTCVLAHSYMNREIIEVADYTGDSYQISANAKESSAQNIIVCGVRFMAETAKILNPGKRVFLPNPLAGCPMAEQFTAEDIAELKRQHPDRAVVAYVNTTAELKKLCDVCVTSSCVLDIIENMEAEKILFIPDCNLGDYVKRNSNKDIMLVEGCCPIHAAATLEDVKRAKALYPDALLLAHPECLPEVVAAADYVGSTSGIMEYAKQSDKSAFIIGTEMSIREHLQYDCPNKRFYPLTQKISCPDMRMTSLSDVCLTLEAIQSGNADCYEINMNSSDIDLARKPIDEMLRFGG
jgi:quinolinate synthase